MEYIYFTPVFILFYMIAVDRNLGEYLYLKLWSEPLLGVRTSVLKYRLLLSIRYEGFLLKRGIVPRRFHKMARDFRNETLNPK